MSYAVVVDMHVHVVIGMPPLLDTPALLVYAVQLAPLQPSFRPQSRFSTAHLTLW